MGGLQKAKKRS